MGCGVGFGDGFGGVILVSLGDVLRVEDSNSLSAEDERAGRLSSVSSEDEREAALKGFLLGGSSSSADDERVGILRSPSGDTLRLGLRTLGGFTNVSGFSKDDPSIASAW
uniref:Uncharacterized protein n=1 Tax=Meloidogyne enterolobii TaxID=390850 RepID=A0A6V7UWA4_MELEN|nr:unnamed protein product [Meloidogyne enterolobii]